MLPRCVLAVCMSSLQQRQAAFFYMLYCKGLGSLDYVGVSVGGRGMKQNLVSTQSAQCLFQLRALVCE